MASTAFNPIVAARTRAAKAILSATDLLAVYTGAGGLESDLAAIRDHGQAAEALNLAQGEAQGAGGGATAALLGDFVALQREYSRVMAVTRAVRSDLARSRASADVLAEVDRILVDEAALTVQIVTQADGKKSRNARRSRAQEAVRAEIARDAGALLDLRGATAALNARGVSADRLRRLKSSAEALSGRLGDRTSKKGAAKGATKAEKAAVAAQSAEWSAHYRILAHAAEANEIIRSLLKEAAR